ncbi:uncharacterized protein [Mytilus edulis]|uniref:uncharacterized protein n=1 Tax=Mytilus edulis TaxID=6550 RepID=UPI0039EFCE19
MNVAVVLSLFLVQAFAMTTKHHGHHGHHTGPTHEPVEHESLQFKYDPHSMTLMMVAPHMCYLYTATGSQLTEVHTAHGLHTLEMEMIRLVDDTTTTHTTISHDDLMAMSKPLAHTCHNAKSVITKLN